MSSITIPVETRCGRSEWSITSDNLRGCDLEAHALGQELSQEVTVEADISYGPYVWCGVLQQECLIQNRESKVLVVVNMTVSAALTKHIKRIYIFADKEDDHFCYRYTTSELPSDPVWTMSFTMPYRSEPTPMRVVFGRAAPQANSSILSFAPIQIVVEKKFVVSFDATTKGIANQECSICLEPTEGDKKLFISRCGHTLHNSCLQQYLETNNLLLPKFEKCKYYHQEHHLSSFFCPMCRTKITSSIKINCY